MNALITVNIPSLQMNEAELLRVLEASIYPGAKPESIKLAIGYCRSQNLDPMLKPVHIVPMDVKTDRKDKDGDWIYEKRDVIMPGVGLYRTTAARTEEYVGCTEPEFGPTKALKAGEFEMDYPEWCRITVRRIVQGHVAEFSAKELWLENFAPNKRGSKVPNAMWQRRPFAQLAKCTEAQALRKAFPEVGAQPTAEEFEGKTIDPAEGMTIDGQTGALVQMPQSKTKEKEQVKAEEKANGRPAAEDKPITKGAVATIKAQLERAGLSTTDLHARFGRDDKGQAIEGWSIDQLMMGQVNDVLDFIRDPTKPAPAAR